jgi:hypothetical protein
MRPMIGVIVLYNRPDPPPDWWPEDPGQFKLPAIVTGVVENSSWHSDYVNLAVMGASAFDGCRVVQEVKFGERPGQWNWTEQGDKTDGL